MLPIYSSENICGALRDLVPFVQFKRREKKPWRSVNFSKAAGFRLKLATLLKLTLLHGCFSRLKLYKWYQIAQHITSGKQSFFMFSGRINGEYWPYMGELCSN